MKSYIIAALVIILSACQTPSTIITKTTYVAVEIPSELLDCSDKKINLPDPKKLKNRDVIIYINRLEKLVNECQSDMSGIKKILVEYKKSVEKLNNNE